MSTPSADPCDAGRCPTCDADPPPALVHDRHCPVTTSASPCPVCAAIGAARGEERQRYADTWKANIAKIEEDWYRRGYLDGAAAREARR